MLRTPELPAVEVRPATVDDASGIARVHVQSWREAYARQLPADLLAGLEEEPRAIRWASRERRSSGAA